METPRASAVCLLFCALSACVTVPVSDWQHGDTKGGALVCVPEGEPPFPAVVYNHGLIVDQKGLDGAAARGYDLRGLCQAFAESRVLAFMPIRRSSYRDQLKEVEAALAATRARPDVDPGRVSLAGFSRGGFLTFLASIRGAEAQSFVLLAPAPGQDQAFLKGLRHVGRIGSPVLAMVERSDDTFITNNVDRLEDALRAADKPHTVIRYDGGEGHALFFTPRYYWPDLIDFLRDPAQGLGAS